MTVSASGSLFYEYVADGLATERNIGFALRRPDDLRVTANGVPQTEGLHYGVAGLSPNQRIVPLAPFWASGTEIAYWRHTAREQEYEIPAGVPLRNESLEDELDRTQLQQQEQDAELARAIKVAPGETPPTGEQLQDQIAVVLALLPIEPLWTSQAAGLASTPSGEEFTVDNGNKTATVYRNNAGTAVLVRDIIIDPTAPAAASLIGTASGVTLQAIINDLTARIVALEP